MEEPGDIDQDALEGASLLEQAESPLGDLQPSFRDQVSRPADADTPKPFDGWGKEDDD